MTTGPITVEDRTMSYPGSTEHKGYMAGLLDEDAEGWARLSGMMAMLALPPVRRDDGTFRARVVEIEVAPNRWLRVDGVALEAHRLICWHGSNGSRIQFEYPRGAAIPRWRMLEGG